MTVSPTARTAAQPERDGARGWRRPRGRWGRARRGGRFGVVVLGAADESTASLAKLVPDAAGTHNHRDDQPCLIYLHVASLVPQCARCCSIARTGTASETDTVVGHPAKGSGLTCTGSGPGSRCRRT